MVGHLANLYAATLMFIAATLGLGLFVSTLAQTQFQAFQLAFLTLLPRQAGKLPLRHALEVRHASFKDERFYDLCRKHNVAIIYAHDEDFPIRQYDRVLFNPKHAIPVEFDADNYLYVVPIEDVVAVFRKAS